MLMDDQNTSSGADNASQEPAAAQQSEQAPYQGGQLESPPETVLPAGPEVTWTASEYVSHHKDSRWYVTLGLITIAVAGILYLITRDLITVGTIIIMAATFGFFGAQKPRTLTYKIDDKGITIDDKLYEYAILKTFSLHKQGAMNYVQVIPTKRFMPPLSIYYAPEQEQEIMDALGNYMAHEEREADPVDRLMHKVRF